MKRKRKSHSADGSAKRQRCDGNRQPPIVPLLEQYHHEVHSLRTYLVSRLPKSAKKRRRRLLHYGVQPLQDETVLVNDRTAQLLDTTLVGTSKHISTKELEQFDQDISLFTQQVTESDISLTPSAGHLKQSEIVDFALWSLFRRYTGSYRPSHLLCYGYQRSAAAANGAEARAVPGVPGVFVTTGNQYLDEFKDEAWSHLPALLGRGAEGILSELLRDCGLYRPVDGGTNMRQLCGTPLHELKPATKKVRLSKAQDATDPTEPDRPTNRRLSELRLLRHRMLYAPPSLSASGNVRFGMTHVHVMSRYRNSADVNETIHVMKYIFPRCFGLHNAFTSSVDVQDTSQPFKDYTTREEEIARDRVRYQNRIAQQSRSTARIPRRLRGSCLRMVERLRKRHSRCSFRPLLDHYCPVMQPVSGETSTFDQASSHASVSAFCRAAIRHVFPPDTFGKTGSKSKSFESVMQSVDRFICLRRYETLSMHDIIQGIVIKDIDWLEPPKWNQNSNMCRSEFEARKDILSELCYYMFDSYLVPLIRSHFHVTESNAHRNQLFYFRHDVWRAMSEPALRSLKLDMFEECSTAEIRGAMAQRVLGVSKVRLLPKAQGMRPIINLRRRVQRQQHGGLVLGRSINSILTPAFSILNHEKCRQPAMLGSALFSVDDMFTRLQEFRLALSKQGTRTSPLYFAKVDVKSCFDTIPQKRLLQLVNDILSGNEYHLAKYARAKLLGGNTEETPGFGVKPSWKFLTRASTDEGVFDLDEEISADSAAGRTRTAYVGGLVQKSQHRQAILDLLHEHVESNIIKLGGRMYRQKEGIPQGSIVSSLLCSYFYAELERNALGFIDSDNSLLLRLIDDFLIITTDRDIAKKFLRTMHAGLPEFGVQVKRDKSRANFDMDIDGSPIVQLPAVTDFPYCGNAINTVTLDLSKDMERRIATNNQDSVTVEYSRLPGQSFYRKTLNALKLHMRAMHLSTSYNSIGTVLNNLHHAFDEVARKSYSYIRSLPNDKQPPSKLIIKTVEDLTKLACALTKRRATSKGKAGTPFECAVTNGQTRWLACSAFEAVFQRRQTKFGDLLRWLKVVKEGKSVRAQAAGLREMVEKYHR